MKPSSMMCATIATMLLVAGFAASAVAQKAETAQKPETPKKPACISEQSDFKLVGKTNAFVVALGNECEQRMQCKVSAYVVGAHGPSQGNATLTLAPKSKGAAAQQSYVMKIKDRFGSGTVSRECKSI